MRRAVYRHLAAAGLPKTAAAVLAAPPSGLTQFLSGAGLDPNFVASLKLPSTHAGAPPVDHLLDMLTAERVEHAGGPVAPVGDNAPPAVSPAGEASESTGHVTDPVDDATSPPPEPTKPVSAEQAAMDAANERWAAADAAYKSTAAGTAARKAATAELQAARDERALARFELALSKAKRASTKDAKYAELTDAKAAAIMRGIQARAAQTTDAAFDSITMPTVSDTPRDASKYSTGQFTVDVGSGQQDVEGRLLDGGTAIWRRSSGDFLVLRRKTDGTYYPVSAANSSAQAKEKAARIPLFDVADPPEGAAQLTKQAHVLVEEAAHKTAADAAEGKAPTAGAQRTTLAKHLDEARATLSAGAAGPFEAERYEATGRHRRRAMEKAADEAAKKAHAQALAAGASPAEAKAAAKKARLQALGTPTRGGGVIPHFDPKIPPPSVGKAQYDAAYRSGIRVFGAETAADYAVVQSRAGNPAAWGFSGATGGGQLPSTSSISSLSQAAAPAMQTLTSKEREAIKTYTGGSYQDINAAITGRDPHPSSYVTSTVTNIQAAFDRLAEHKKSSTEVATVVRGTKVPSAWHGSRESYLAKAFPIGAKMQIGKVTSCSTSASTASSFNGGGSVGYLMAIRTRDGLPVKSISLHAGEDEVIVPPGVDLRCVHIDTSGNIPVVYLVAEDLVAEADQAA